MAVLLGDKRRFAVEVGDWDGPALRRVDLWAADQWLTCDDNAAFVPQFRHSVKGTAVRVCAGHGSPLPFAGLSPAATHRRFVAATGNDDELLREQFWIFHWGPTTDNLLAFHFRDGDELVLTFQFWREEHLLKHPGHAGAVFVVEIQAAEFAGILEDLIANLDRG
jgi:hypothetical protein